MRPLKFFLVMICAGLMSSCGGGANSSGGNFNVDPLPTDSVSGTVTFKGTPLSGVKVTAFLTNSNVIYLTTTTDANGNYSFTGLKTSGNVAGEYQFWASSGVWFSFSAAFAWQGPPINAKSPKQARRKRTARIMHRVMRVFQGALPAEG